MVDPPERLFPDWQPVERVGPFVDRRCRISPGTDRSIYRSNSRDSPFCPGLHSWRCPAVCRLLAAFARTTIILCPTRPPRTVVNMPPISLPRQCFVSCYPAGESSSLRGRPIYCAAIALGLLLPAVAIAGEPTSEQLEFFEKKIP